MDFTPRTEQEIIDSKLWKKADYDFLVEDGSDKVSNKGHPMIEIKLRLSDGNGKSRVLTDYLLAETPEKLRHAASAAGCWTDTKPAPSPGRNSGASAAGSS